MDGSDRTTLIEWVEWPYQRPTALTIDMDENVLYWVGDLYPACSSSTSAIRTVKSSITSNSAITCITLLGLLLMHIISIGQMDNHPCVDSCSHLCLLKPGGYKCACSDDCATPCNESIHVTNTFGCTNDPSLYFIDTHHIKCIDLESSNQTYVSVKTVRSDIIQGGAIDIDHRERMIYWSDNALWTISRMSLVTGDTEVIIRHDLGEVLALAVDWESGLIYWTDFTFERIEVAKLDGSYRKTLFTTGFYSPRGIAVDPVHGYMFWTDFGFDYPRIERADLTGDNRQALVSFGLDWYYQFHPVNVVIEYQTRLVYWIDKYNNYIDYADIDGGNKTNLDYIGERFNPVDLALYGDMLYWADWPQFQHSISQQNAAGEWSDVQLWSSHR
ncbi:Low-density lipoprotein receptor- protein 6 [Desmophyllum pertusum]|uniref:Low-density lipoprotein receptor- protein 6 n=1 Tax=Desmophyllum pertusum TaxID=174260 RepID=A0A9W9ZAF0_9CNID|nr:Low-density lipoprotein receptor- protein 6 [Desmophyllum pertusum]